MLKFLRPGSSWWIEFLFSTTEHEGKKLIINYGGKREAAGGGGMVAPRARCLFNGLLTSSVSENITYT
jgi:hypothetical protein